MQQYVVAVYKSAEVAERARKQLIKSGVDEDDIRVSSGQYAGADQVEDDDDDEGFFEWLFGSSDDADNDEDRPDFGRHIQAGAVALTVAVDDDEDASTMDIETVLEQFDPIDIHEENAATGMTQARSGRSQSRVMDGSGEEVIPLSKEELVVGKTETERRHRIRTHVVERPVEGQVRLRDERVVIERRPRRGTVSGDADEGLLERDVEIIERHEKPMVGKRVRADEEVVIRKQADEHVETVRDTVRETEIDAEEDDLPVSGRGRGRREP